VNKTGRFRYNVVFFVAWGLLFFCNCIRITAQGHANPDAGAWMTFNMEKRINARFNLLLAEEMRLRENFTRLNLFYTNIGLEYKIRKNIRTAFIYRFTEKYLMDGSVGFRHRGMWDVSVKKKLGEISLVYRHRLQMEFKDVLSTETGRQPEWFSRNRIMLKYKTTT
jgi:hypothetical protein